MGLYDLHLVQSTAWEKHYELPIHGVRTQRQMNRLTSKLVELQQPTDRFQQLVYEMKVSPQVFSGDQVIELAPYFPGTELVLALHLLDHHLFGLRCDQAVRLLQMIPVPEQRLDALQVIDENLLDPVNRFQLRNLFPPYLLTQVDQILAEVRGQSHIYGSVTSARVIFLIDTSGSMSTEFRTNCGQYFNRLQFIVHDLHKILHHRVQPHLKFNIMHFGTHVHQWKHSLTPATSHHLKEAEHYLDHLQPYGHTNTYDALKQALTHEEADTIYLLSDGEPSMDMRTVLLDLKVWLQQRRNPCVIHTIAFLMGNAQNDPRAREFMAEIAAISRGVFRCIDPFTPLHQEFGGDSYSDNPNFGDDAFVQLFEGKLRDVPPNLLQSFDLYRQQQYSSSTMGASSIPYQTQPLYPVQQYSSPPALPPNANYQPPQQNMPSVIPPYQGQGFQNPPPNTSYQPSQQNMPSVIPPYQGQGFQNLPPPTNTNYQPPQQNMPSVIPPYQGQGFQNPPPNTNYQPPQQNTPSVKTPYPEQSFQNPPPPTNTNYQPQQQNMPSVIPPYQGQGFQNPPPNTNYQPPQQNMPSVKTPYPEQSFQNPPPSNANYQSPQQNMPSVKAPYQGQGFQNSPPPNFKSQIKSRPRLQDEICIPSLHHVHGHDRFDILLNIRQIVPRHDGQWSVSHTFDELKQLHHQLEKRCSVPAFPPNHKSLIHIGKHDHEKRRQELEAYLKQLYVYVSPYEHPEFDLFLLMELHVNQLVQQAEAEWKTHEQQQSTSLYEDEPPPYNLFTK
jgi:hypothetical protein